MTLPSAMKPGQPTLTFRYTGKIETEPHGLFAQEFTKPGGGKDMLLSTQFEATDARRMFPCWDEPAFRATYQLTVTTPAAWASYSNVMVTRRTVDGALANYLALVSHMGTTQNERARAAFLACARSVIKPLANQLGCKQSNRGQFYQSVIFELFFYRKVPA